MIDVNVGDLTVLSKILSKNMKTGEVTLKDFPVEHRASVKKVFEEHED
jgi:hypothetical protein